MHGIHSDRSHHSCNHEQLIKNNLLQQTAKKVSENKLPPHKAYKFVAREHSNDIQTMRGWRDAKATAYAARNNSGLMLPKSPEAIKSIIIKANLHTNMFGQRSSNDNIDTKPNEWHSKSSLLYLGDGGHAKFQVFCEHDGAGALSKADYIHFDVSFKFTPWMPFATEH